MTLIVTSQQILAGIHFLATLWMKEMCNLKRDTAHSPWPVWGKWCTLCGAWQSWEQSQFYGPECKARGDSIKPTRSQNWSSFSRSWRFSLPTPSPRFSSKPRRKRLQGIKKWNTKSMVRLDGGEGQYPSNAQNCTHTHTQYPIEHLGLVKQFTAARRIRSTRPSVWIT